MKLSFLARDESHLFRHGSLLIAGALAGAVCNAGFHMVVGRTLPNSEYGALVAMLGVILAVTTPMLAVQNTLAHFISALLLEGRREAVMHFFRRWLVQFAGVSLLIVLGGIWFRHELSAFGGGLDPRLVVATAVVLAASLWMSLFFGLFQGVQAFGWLAWTPQAWGGVRLLLGWVSTVWISATALAAMTAQGVGVAAVLALGGAAVVILRLPRAAGRMARPRGTHRYLALALICLAGFGVLMNLDTALVRRYFDAETAGLFAKAATIARTAVFLPVPIANALFPKVTSRGELTPVSWRLLLRALAYAGVIIAAVSLVCLAFPHLPWMILYGRWSPEEAAMAARLTRAMVLAMSPLALVYLLLNFEMAQRRFRPALVLAPLGLAYIGGVAVFHNHPWQVASILGVLNLFAAVWLSVAVFRQRPSNASPAGFRPARCDRAPREAHSGYRASG